MRHFENMIFSGRYFIENFLKSSPALGGRVFAGLRETWVSGNLVKKSFLSCFILSDDLRHDPGVRWYLDRGLKFDGRGLSFSYALIDRLTSADAALAMVFSASIGSRSSRFRYFANARW